ncbi:MAG: ATP-binding cassette domain-containing protein [Thermoplasmata archaeon]
MELIFHHLYKYLKNNLVLNDINFSIKSTKLAIVGHNGSGKTTLLSLISGLLRPDAGYVMIDGIEPYFERQRIVKHISFTFEKGDYPYNMNVGEYIKFLKKIRDEKIVSEIVNILRISKFENSSMKELSSGQAQLLYLLSALTSNSPIVVLDEPFNHLDPAKYVKIINFIQRMEKEMIISTQNFSEAEELCDDYIVLKEGAVIWKGTREDLYSSNLYEIYLNGRIDSGIKIIQEMGKMVIAEADIDYLIKLLKEGKILGFKKAGLRSIENIWRD